MNNSKYIILAIATCLFFITCKEENLGPAVAGGPAPDQVSNVRIVNRPGGAKITYDLPSSKNLLYIMAAYQTKDGQSNNVKSSSYCDSIIIEGLGDTSIYEVKLFSVSRSEVASEPVLTKIRPLPPPIWDIYNSFNMLEDFGGVTVLFNNELSANISVTLLAADSQTGEMVAGETFYTKQKNGRLSLRGLNTNKRAFGVFVKDRWGNYSDTLIRELSPLNETKLDKSKFLPVTTLPGEPDWWSYGPMTNLWSENMSDGNYSGQKAWFRTANGSGLVHHFTFDLGVTAKLSRYQQWQRGTVSEQTLLYANGNPRRWEVWGSTNPAPDGSFNGWTKLLDCENIKPSGLPLGQISNDDLNAARSGDEFTFPLDAPPVRYIRIKVLETWAKVDYVHIDEVTFYGNLE